MRVRCLGKANELEAKWHCFMVLWYQCTLYSPLVVPGSPPVPYEASRNHPVQVAVRHRAVSNTSLRNLTVAWHGPGAADIK